MQKDHTLKLKNAEFQIIDKDGNVVGKLVTDESGKAISEPLVFGKYEIKEIKAPTGYMILKESIHVELTSPLQKLKVENNKSEWSFRIQEGLEQISFTYLAHYSLC